MNVYMILSKQKQDEFFKNYLPLLYYAAIYDGLLPEGSTLKEFGRSPLEIKVQSRDVLFNDENVIDNFLGDNGTNLGPGGIAFAKNVQTGIYSDFILLREYKNFTVLLQASTETFYEVINITERFSQILSFIPCFISTAIFNFDGKIICDGMIKNGNIQIGPNYEQSFLEQYRQSKAKSQVVKLL
jgi:hypothetical protein